MKQKEPNSLPAIPISVDVEKLTELIPEKTTLLFFMTWLKHDRNATDAYLELHPGVSVKTANVCGSRMLSKVDKKALLYAFGLTESFYMTQLQAGAEATKIVDDGEGFTEVPDHSVRRQYHKVVGELLGVETKDQTVTINLPSPIYGGKSMPKE